MSSLIADRYDLGGIIGHGGMSEVYSAEDTLLGREVAIKMLRRDMAADESFRERFRREAQNYGRLNHPCIVSVYDTGDYEMDGIAVPYIVMERVYGRNLRDVVREDGPLAPADAATMLVSVCHALEASHEAGIIHRDVKPANIMITNTGAVKVMDFGIARALDDATSAMTQTQAVIGTAQYLSPEQARGKSADERSDVYSLGCVLYEAVTGHPPFTGESPFSVAFQHVQEDPTPPSEHIPDLTPTAALNIDAVVLTAMAKHPADRYQSAAEMAADLERLARNAVTQAARTYVVAEEELPAVVPAPAPKKRSNSVLIALSIMLSVGIIGVGGAMAYQYFDWGTSQESTVMVPDLTGRSQQEGVQALEDLGLRVDIIDEPSPDVPRGTIIRTNPAAGSSLQEGTSVRLTVSSGKEIIEVPDIKEKTPEEARHILDEAGLELDQNVKEEASDTIPQGQIVSQQPTAGSQISKGSKVSITMSSGVEEVRVPSITGMRWEEADATLRSLGFIPQQQVVHDRQPAGVVTACEVSDTYQAKGSTIIVQVSDGALIPAPDLRNLNSRDALRKLHDSGWEGPDDRMHVGPIVETGNLVQRGLVAEQVPAPGEDLAKDGVVVLRYYEFNLNAFNPGAPQP